MIEHHIDIPTADGAMNTFVVHPDEGGPHPVILFYMDAPGKREELHDMARRLATVGYCVVLPNLYYRRTRDYWLKERTDEGFAEMFTHMHSLSAQTVRVGTQAMLDHVDGLAAADRTRIGAVGYCMSGQFSINAAARHAGRVKAAASIHGTFLVTDKDDSPHLAARKASGELYFGCAEIDRWAPAETVEALAASLKADGIKAEVEVYPGVQHGFVFPQRALYDKAAAEQHWARLNALFRRNLG